MVENKMIARRKVKCEVLADNVVLYQGDCRDIVSVLKLKDAAVLTDPPYGRDTVYGRGQLGVRAIEGDESVNLGIEVLSVLAKMQKHAWLMTFYACQKAPQFFSAVVGAGLPYFGEIIWDKKAPGLEGGGGIRYQHENIAVFRVGEPAKLRDFISVQSAFRSSDKHPHQKPPALMERLCLKLPCSMVVDPFMGSGMTGVGAVKSGKGFIGIERDPDYFKTAVAEISKAMDEPELHVSVPRLKNHREYDSLFRKERPRPVRRRLA